jgi:hypothetical protein
MREFSDALTLLLKSCHGFTRALHELSPTGKAFFRRLCTFWTDYFPAILRLARGLATGICLTNHSLPCIYIPTNP